MSWTLSASGHIPAAGPDGAPQDTLAVEKELYERVREVLSDPKYVTSGSGFSGSHVSGSLHLPDQPDT